MFLPFVSSSSLNRAEKPLRVEILSRDQLAARAAELAEFYSSTQKGGRGARLHRRFRENCRVLNSAYFQFAEASRQKDWLAAGAEWLLDNFHVIDEQVRDIRRDLPRSYYKALPKLTADEWKGYPRVYQIVCEFISHTDAIVEIDTLTHFIQAYQSKNVLMIGEIWAVPIMLRLALVENLRRLARSGLRVSEHRRLAERLCQEVIDPPGLGGTELLLKLIQRVKEYPDVLDYGAAHILRRLRAKGPTAALSLQWIDEQLRAAGIDPGAVDRAEQQSQAVDQISVGNSVTALKTIGSMNWRDWFERVSHVDEILRTDPAALYTRSDFSTRDLCRHKVEHLARRTKFTEVQVAQKAVELAARATVDSADEVRFRHIGYYLIDDGLEKFRQELEMKRGPWRRLSSWAKARAFPLYAASVILCILALLGLILAYSVKVGGSTSWLVVCLLLLPLPLSELSILLVQFFVNKLISPKPLAKLDFEEGIPESARSAVVVQTIVADRDSLERVIEQLEIRAIGNLDPHIHFGILADLSDASTETLSGDMGIIHRGQELIGELNSRYCPGGDQRFFIMFRRRTWNPVEQKFLGWERKRGKIMEFNRFLRGATDTSFVASAGNIEALRGIRYVITLDNDTRLPPASAHKLIGTIAHPLNRAVFDEKTNVVKKGYAIIQPRVGITLESANVSRFSSVFSGTTGLDPYTRTVSDVYQDLFSEGSYIGKGVYDVDAFERALKDRFPENALLSHDLIEGLFARCGLASDIEVFDEFPQRYHAQAKRQQRWMRGDWQLLPWMGRQIPAGDWQRYRSPLSGLGRWKLFDNLRRSLVPISLFLWLVAVWALAPGQQAFWLLVLLGLVSFSIYSLSWRLIFNLPFGYSFSSFFASLYRDLKRSCWMVFLQITFLPHQMLLSLNAIGVTLYRLLISRKRLLEWETAASAERRLGGDLADFWTDMAAASIVSVLAAVFVALSSEHQGLWWGLPFLTAWIVSPNIAWLVSRKTPRPFREIGLDDRIYLRGVAFDTWRYFDTYLVPEYNYLIPDNLQLIPARVVAERTSPTNISLSMLSVISANDLGFIPLTGVVDRLSHTFATLERLERFHGHYLNWYSIRDLRPLNPRYISTVDSGNFVGHIIAARQALLSYPYTALITENHLRHIESLLASVDDTRLAIRPVLARLPKRISNLRQLTEAIAVIRSIVSLPEFSRVPEATQRVLIETLTLEPLLSWSEHLVVLQKLGERQLLPRRLKGVDRILEGRTPSLSLILKLTNRLLRSEDIVPTEGLSEPERLELTQLVAKLKDAHARLRGLGESIDKLCKQIEQIVTETDFKFLYDGQKKLFVIGYNIDNGQRDNSYYDLLASEARLASLVSIAVGQIPQSHWFLLNRGLTDSPGGKSLLSWAGTMFEYLMPLLVTKDYPSTLLSETYRAVVKTQRLYGIRRGVPWGVSESAYSGVDFEKTYQYRAFGIPGLGLKRGLAEDLVISPYSTAMALIIDPIRSIQNLRRLERDGVRGDFGFYEAVDYTDERLGTEEKFHVVRSFLAHHQGMSLVSINNALNQEIFQHRFHNDPHIRSCELLLQERFPNRIPVIQPHQAEVQSVRPFGSEGRTESSEHIRTARTSYPLTRILSNGHYSVIIDNAGSGASLYDSDIAINRWREDSLNNQMGTFIYIRDVRADGFWSVGYQPARVEPEIYEAIFSPDKVELKRRDRGIATLCEITVSPEDNVEVRRVTLTNLSQRLRELELTSFAEVALAARRADSAHPAFSKMFIESEYLEEYDALLFSRRPRSDHDEPLYMMHLSTMNVVWAPPQHETSREKFLGRGGTPLSPLAMQRRAPLSGTVGTVLDPIFSVRQMIEIEPGASETITFVTGIARSRDEILHLIRKYREGQHISRAFEMAWSHSHVEIRHQQFSIAGVHNFQKLANAILFNVDSLRAPAEIIKRCNLSQSGLWRFGISGDEPIVLLVITDPEQVELSQDLLLAHEYLRLRGLRFDLVILNEYPSGYMQDLQQELEFTVRTSISSHSLEKRGGIFLRSQTQLSQEEINLLYAAARVVIFGNRGPLADQLRLEQRPEPIIASHKPEKRLGEQEFRPATQQLEYFNGFGGFADNGKSYQMVVRHDRLPPLPWTNVCANPRFGFLTTESGAGYTWADNSRENRLSHWSNDPIIDPFGEVIYMRDTDSGEYWCPTPRPVRQDQTVSVKHHFGYSTFTSQFHQIHSELTISGSLEEPVKWWHLELINNDTRERKIEVFLYFEWVLGVGRPETFRMLRSEFDKDRRVLCVTNPFNTDFPHQVVFLGSNQAIQSFTTNRKEFVGRNRDLGNPLALELGGASHSILGQRLKGARSNAVQLSGQTGAGFDSAAVLKVERVIPPGEKHHVQFFVAKSEGEEGPREMSAKYRSLAYRNTSFEQVKQHWNSITETVQIKTPVRSFDIMANGWLQYQTLSCRMYARSGLFQSSGAIGFRDQLQDSMALTVARPEITRNQILLNASRQFPEGDVQHWWHPPTGRGIRTRISDNYMWMPLVVDYYLRTTGDNAILDEKIPFIEAPLLEANQHDLYLTPTVSQRVGSLYEHCLLALDRCLVVGPHGLPPMGGGDWNDGMNLVGIEGKGESVWLGWFFASILKSFASIVENRGDQERAAKYRQWSTQFVEAVENNAWDGGWYRRAYFDDGTPMGSAQSSECKIDSLAQSWAVITGLGKPERQQQAMQALYEHLVKRDEALICLLTPAFQSTKPNPGYIQSYPPGLRENGGQYTHAAAWVVLAAAVMGDGDRAMELFEIINPINHSDNGAKVERYRTEPFVTCGDVYSNPAHVGRGGWSWYTGSSGWLYRGATEYIAGLRVCGDHFMVDPCIPKAWDEFEITFRYRNSHFHITVKNPQHVSRGVKTIRFDGVELPDNKLPLNLEKERIEVEVVLGSS